MQEQPRDRYRAFRLSTERPEPFLFLVFRNQDYLILPYADLESIGNPPGVEPNSVVVLIFRGSVIRKVRIEGRGLLFAVRYLWRQEVACLKETPEGWDDSENIWEAVITRMVVQETSRPAGV